MIRAMHISALTLELHLPGCDSLKEKRGRIKPLLAGLHRQYNVSAAEIERQDNHIGMCHRLRCGEWRRPPGRRVLAKLPDWIEKRYPDVMVVDQHVMKL